MTLYGQTSKKDANFGIVQNDFHCSFKFAYEGECELDICARRVERWNTITSFT